MDLRDTYDKIAERWHAEAKGQSLSPGRSRLLELLPSGSYVLDVGCGTGLFSAYLLRAGMNVLGIDTSEGMLSIARRENPDGVFRQQDLADIATMEERFGAICATAVLLHRPRAELRPILRSFRARLQPGGYLFVALKEKRPDRPEEGMVVEDHLGERIERFFSFFTQEEVEEAFREEGFSVAFSSVTPSGRARWIEVVGQRSGA